MQAEQIISHGYTTQSDWQELEQRSRETRRKNHLQCPLCSGEIHPTDTTHLQCLSCDAPVEVYQHRERTDTADTRIIYAEVYRQHRALVSIDLQCLSCERTLQADETCTNTCPIQTYLVLDFQDAELTLKRAANLLDVPRDTPEIPIRNLPDTDSLTRAENLPRPKPDNQPPNQTHASDFETPEHPNAHKDIAGQIEAYLSDAPNNTATTAEMIKAIGCSPQGFNVEKEKLIEAGKIKKVKRGVYQLINHT